MQKQQMGNRDAVREGRESERTNKQHQNHQQCIGSSGGGRQQQQQQQQQAAAAAAALSLTLTHHTF